MEFNFTNRIKLRLINEKYLLKMGVVGIDKEIILKKIGENEENEGNEEIDLTSFDKILEKQNSYSNKAEAINQKIFVPLLNCKKNIPKQLITKYLDNSEISLKEIQKTLLDNSSTILVLGDLKSGKSLFINTCLRSNLLPSKEIKCTTVPTKISFLENKFRVRVKEIEKIEQIEDGEFEIDFKEQVKLNKEEINSFKLFQKLSQDNVLLEKNYSSKKIFFYLINFFLKTRDNLEETQNWIEKINENYNPDHDYNKELENFLFLRQEEREELKFSEVHIEFHSEILKNGITFIDSPGVNENGILDKMVEREIKKTNGIFLKVLKIFYFFFVFFFCKVLYA